mgnify:CR=1 FL=1
MPGLEQAAGPIQGFVDTELDVGGSTTLDGVLQADFVLVQEILGGPATASLDVADQVLSAMRAGFGGHTEKGSS